MKRYLFLVSLFAGALLVSCNQDLLDIPQKGVVGYDDFYITDEDAESAAVTMYADFAQNIGGQEGTWVPYTFGFNNCADNMLAAGNFYTDNDFSGELNEFRYDDNSQVISTLYKRFYWTNHKCNLITDNFKYGDSDVKDRVISEARVIRAWLLANFVMTVWATELVCKICYCVYFIATDWLVYYVLKFSIKYINVPYEKFVKEKVLLIILVADSLSLIVNFFVGHLFV